MSRSLHFPENFTWGTATASYQIEGGKTADGKGLSIWDEFSNRAKTIVDNSTGDVACDHFNRYPEDINLMSQLGYSNYRLSLSWPRIIPDGKGAVNKKGLDFYSKLIDTLLEKDITPYVTFFHWDLPLALQESGGWANRDTAYFYRDYASSVVDVLGDRVENWMTHNEPWVHSFVGHLFGEHAPGLKNLKTALQTAHHILLSHGLAVPIVKEAGGKVGIVHNLEWIEPASSSVDDAAAASRHDGAFNRWFLDPVFKGSYPQDMMNWYGNDAPEIQAGDMRIISQPTDFLGINYYTRRIIAHDPQGDFLQVKKVLWPFQKRSNYEEWENSPEGLYKLLMRVSKEYGHPPLYITENGTPLNDVPENGAVNDPKRVEYLTNHFSAAWQAIQDGADIRGYFVWTFIDNFEWSLGFTKRFGLVYVNHDSQERIVKDSGKWYSEVCASNTVETQ